MSTTLETPISSFETNRRRVGALKSLGVLSVGDALTYYPFRVTDPIPARSLREVKIGEKMTFAAHVREARAFPMARRGFRLIVNVDDTDFARSHHMNGASAVLVFFSYRKSYVDWMQRRLHAGALAVISGEPSVYNDQLQFTHPDILTVNPASAWQGESGDAEDAAQSGEWDDGFGVGLSRAAYTDVWPASDGGLKFDAQTVDEALRRACRPRPVYHASSRISSEHIHDEVLKCMDMLRGEDYLAKRAELMVDERENGEFDVPRIDRETQMKALAGAIPDIIPETLREQHGLMHRAEAFMSIHDPVDHAHFEQALHTLRYEEALICQTALVKARDASQEATAAICADVTLKNEFIASLPFDLTAGQQTVIDDIAGDMSDDHPMRRLLQGEVGSGKTVVAIAAMMQAVGSGHQAVLVAPTLVLAEQHYDNITRMVADMRRMRRNGMPGDDGETEASGIDASEGTEVADGGESDAKNGESMAKTTHNSPVDESGQVDAASRTAPTKSVDNLDMDDAVQGTFDTVRASENAAESAAARNVSMEQGDAASTRVTSAEDEAKASAGTHGKRFDGNDLPALKGNDLLGLKSGEIPVLLLTGGMRLAERRRVLAIAASGTPCIIVATHAAFSKTFQAPNLALAVIDEQHRFGVEQRESLNSKGEKAPHLLVMTATPIPRSAAMTWFGDLDISWLTELPGGRKPIHTFVVSESDGAKMAEMFTLIRSRIEAGERAYVVCPRIDADSEDADTIADADDVESGAAFDDAYDLGEDDEQRAQRPPLHSVAEITERLRSLPQFAGIRFATLTGRDSDDVKTQVMADFASGKTPILVATIVIEVGVDVAKASCMVIFDADRYGLSQLHQLRGRVGRGGTDSGAFLISRAPEGSDAARRLAVIQGTLDGAKIAQADLEFRGAGDVLGDAQSGGKSSLKLLRVVKDVKIIESARAEAKSLVARDPELLDHVQLAGAVLDFTRGNETFLTSN